MSTRRRHGFFKRNGLSLVLVTCFAAFFAGQIWFGWLDYNADQKDHAKPEVSLAAYLHTGHFMEATAENLESEFLQMAAYIVLTVRLYQLGSSESKKLDESEEVDRDPRLSSAKPDAPWPVRRGGVVLRLYENSLVIAFGLLFLGSIALHAWGGAIEYSEEQLVHGQPAVGVWQYVSSPRFWFESFQNWQSEFLALFAMVVLSIHLRQRGSPESKPVDASHEDTGGG